MDVPENSAYTAESFDAHVFGENSSALLLVPSPTISLSIISFE
jgi:hypothetical protein